MIVFYVVEMIGRKQSWPIFEFLFWNLLGGTEENHENVNEDDIGSSQV
jgi:hypothetical protein